MSNCIPGVVIPVGPGRAENLVMVLDRLQRQTFEPEAVVIVFDGPDAAARVEGLTLENAQVAIPKHTPGQEQPRNVGVRHLQRFWEKCNAVWFLDTDVIFGATALEQLVRTWEGSDTERVIIGPYDWLPDGVREIEPALRNDPRWAMFNEDRWLDRSYESRGELNVGLACFSGNLMWPIAEFMRIGGFWSEIHHGRCEDGELGLRAVALGVPITCCPTARGYHLAHPVNHAEALRRNERDVPMINARHPWVEGEDVFVVDRDGRRFEQRCDRCGAIVNTLDWWSHRAECAP
jgi:GT2 family glycosyltransferase